MKRQDICNFSQQASKSQTVSVWPEIFISISITSDSWESGCRSDDCLLRKKKIFRWWRERIFISSTVWIDEMYDQTQIDDVHGPKENVMHDHGIVNHCLFFPCNCKRLQFNILRISERRPYIKAEKDAIFADVSLSTRTNQTFSSFYVKSRNIGFKKSWKIARVIWNAPESREPFRTGVRLTWKAGGNHTFKWLKRNINLVPKISSVSRVFFRPFEFSEWSTQNLRLESGSVLIVNFRPQIRWRNLESFFLWGAAIQITF
jgi:hypothetical protein